MRGNEFREWLGRRSHKGVALTGKGIENRVRKMPRIERALEALGFDERNLDTLHANGRWPDLMEKLREIASDWQVNETAARLMAPQAPNPSRQLGNLPNAARQYGHFVDGKDPNYDAEGDVANTNELNEEALEALRRQFLDRFSDFESGGGFPGRSGYHPEEDDYKRALIAKVEAALAASPPLDDAALGTLILDLVASKDSNLLGYYRTARRLGEVRRANPGVLESASGQLARSPDDPSEAVEQFLGIMWPLWRQGTEDNLPYAEARILPTLILALARPADAISVIYQRYHNLGMALLGRPLFGNNVLTREEYRTVLNLAGELFRVMDEEWDWQPRDLWDVQGFIWVTCEEKLEARGERDADRIRRHVLETYVRPARQRQDATVDVLVRDVNEALGLNQAWPNICQALAGRKFLEMAELSPPERIGKDQSSATVFRFGLTKAAGRPFVLFDADGAAFKPVRHGERDGRSVFKIKPPGASNKAEEAMAVDTIAEVAKAMLVDGLPARVQSVSGGPVNYIGYGKQKLVRYELDPAIAKQIGVPPTGSVGLASPADLQEESRPMPNPTNLILYGPPGTGKTWRTAEEAVVLCDGAASADREALMARYGELVEARRIDFVTFHQSYSYEEFVEGLRPQQGGPEAEGPAMASAGFSLVPEEGIFRRIAHRAAASRGGGGQFAIGDRQVFKLSIGEAAKSEDDYLFEEALADSHVLLGYDDIDWSDAAFEDRNAIIAACRDYDREHPESDRPEPTAHTGRVQCPLIFRNWIKRGDLVIISKGNSRFRAIGEVTGDYEYAPRESGVYSHRRKVNWLWIDKAGAPVDDIYAKGFSMRAVYLMTPGDLNTRALESYINSQLPGAGPAEPEPYVLIIDEINRGNISKILGELITLIEPDKRAGMPNAIEVRLPYSKEPFSVPANLHIVGTMNTADRSIALLDTALRRRFVFREIAPEPARLSADVDGVPLRRVLETINDRIEYLIDREHRIGHAFFIGDGGKDRAAIDATMRDKVIPLLQEYFFEDWGRVAAVLGEPQGKGGGFLDCRKLRDPTGKDGEDRESWSVRLDERGRPAFSTDAYDRLVGKPAPAAPVLPSEEPLDEAAE